MFAHTTENPLSTRFVLHHILQTVPENQMIVIISDNQNTGVLGSSLHFDDQDLVAELHKNGYHCIVIDWQQISFEDCYKLAKWAKTIIIRSAWNYVDDVESFCAKMGVLAMHGKLLNPWRFAVANTSKGMYLRQAEQYGIPITPTIWLDPNTKPEWNSYFSKFGEKLFLKPMRGSAAKGCLAVTKDNLNEANDLIEEYKSQSIGMMIQPCLKFKAPERKLIFIGRKFGDAFSHAVTQASLVATSLDQVTAYSPTPDELELGNRVRDFVCKIARIEPEELLFLRVDIFIDENGKLFVNEFSVLEDQLYLRKNAGATERLVEAILCLLNLQQKTKEHVIEERHTEPLEKSKIGILNLLYSIVRLPFSLLKH